MRLLLLNPNTTAAMTDALVAQLTPQLPPGTTLHARTAPFGAPVIATRVSFAIAAHAAIDAFTTYRDQHGPPDATILACFGDPGLAALRELTDRPVIGLADASFSAAKTPFAVLTSGPAWPAMLREQITLHPNAPLCRGVFALQTTGLAVSQNPDGHLPALNALAAEARAAGATTLILGGAALAGLAPRLEPGPTYLDCLTAAAAQLPGHNRALF
jgi:Asp/Glu/hydantoin racemase